MTRKMTIRMKGFMTAESPIAIVPPGTDTVLHDGQKVPKVSNEVVIVDGVRKEVPRIPSSTLRGALRRAAYEVSWMEAAKNGDKMTVRDYQYNAIGGAKGDESEKAEDILQRKLLRAQNPLIGLFGAGHPWATSHALVGSAYGDHNTEARMEVVGGRRTDDIAQNPGILDLMVEGSFEEWKDLRETTKEDQDVKKKIKALEKKRVNASPEEKRAINAEIEDLEGQKSGKNSVLRPLYHGILPRGMRLSQNITLTDVTPEEAGLFLAALDHFWMERPYFGGKISHGYGLVSASWDVLRKDRRDWIPIGEVAVEPHAGLTRKPAESSEWLDAWDAYRASGELCLAAPAA